MNGHVIAVVATLAILAATAVLACLAMRDHLATQRFEAVTAAQNQRTAAYRVLEVAYRSGRDPSQAEADAAAADEAARQAESRLPRGRRTRAYFAAKETRA